MISEYIKNICKIGQGGRCCKYLLVGTQGFECSKADEQAKNMIDSRSHGFVSQGDNCPGNSNLRVEK